MTDARDSGPPFDPYHYIVLAAACAVLGGLAAWTAGGPSAWKLVAILGAIVVLLWGAGAIAIHRRSGGVGPRVG
jgi:hypothetical protein